MDPTQLLDLARLLVTGIAPLIAGGALAKIGENATDTRRRSWDASGACSSAFPGSAQS